MTKIFFGDRCMLEVTELPSLTGTEKQVAWAEDIRAFAINEMRRAFDHMRTAKNINDSADLDRGAEFAHKTFAPLFDTKTEAKYWIDNRNTDIRTLAKSL
ncbi:hypothetical protein [Ancylobacter sp. IITR112]|uniref:hypothetical protein n=1 Tax=Ancylobacter sp. IITR112 TaxID=3138073 RepID=UPI00352B8FCA